MDELVVVTGASSSRFAPLENLLFSLRHFASATRVIVYDLGLTLEQAARLEGVELRRFPFELQPAHVANLQCFAWKPILFRAVLAEGAPTLWLDAADLIHGPLGPIAQVIDHQGVYSPINHYGTLRRWTMPAMLEWFGISRDEEILDSSLRRGSIFGLHPRHVDVAEWWCEAALDPGCIAPAGADIFNHRFDEAAISIIVHLARRTGTWHLIDELLGVSSHNIDLSHAEARAMCIYDRPRLTFASATNGL